MKKFGLLVAAAMLGSIITLGIYKWMNPYRPVFFDRETAPISRVAYKSSNILPMDFTATSEKVLPTVVHIRTLSSGSSRSDDRGIPEALRHFFDIPDGGGQPSQGFGSGVIINPDGYIVTNNHVVDDADVVEVTLYNNRKLKAEVLGKDPDTDLAVIKINEKNLPHLSFVNSDMTKVGEWVLAVGNPFNLNSTVTAGIISAKGRNINIINQRGNPTQQNTAIESFIQTDAAINPGNSGGALVNLDGGLIGINAAIASPTGSYSGYGFAIPSNLVSKVVEDIIKYGTVQRGWIGVQIQEITPELVKENDLSVDEGVYITDLPEKSAGKEAGLKVGDVIVKIDNRDIKTNASLIEYIGEHRPGDKVNVVVNRKGKISNYMVTLKSREGNTSLSSTDKTEAVASLGVEFESVDSKVLRRMELSHGVRVKKIMNGKIQKATDMREGFVITHVDDKAVSSPKEVEDILKKKKPGDQVTFAGMYEDYPREYLFALRM